MKNFRLSKVALVSLCVISSGMLTPATAKSIYFEKGNYCGSYFGDINNETFVLDLKAKQKLFISIDQGYVDNIHDTKGSKFKDKGGAKTWLYSTKVQGNHFIKTASSGGSSTIDFCVF